MHDFAVRLERSNGRNSQAHALLPCGSERAQPRSRPFAGPKAIHPASLPYRAACCSAPFGATHLLTRQSASVVVEEPSALPNSRSTRFSTRFWSDVFLDHLDQIVGLSAEHCPRGIEGHTIGRSKLARGP